MCLQASSSRIGYQRGMPYRASCRSSGQCVESNRSVSPWRLFRNPCFLGPQPWREVLDLALEMAEDLLHPRPFHPAPPHLEVATDLRQPVGAESGAARLEGVSDEDEIVVVPGGQSPPQLREPERRLGQETVDDG